MGKIFYTDNSNYTSEEVIKKILSEFYGITNATILRTQNGKPYIKNGPSFSVSHTTQALFIAFSSKNVGLDAELLSRKLNYASIVKKLSLQEQKEITNAQDLLKHWVVRESAVKYLGGTLAHDLKKLAFIQNRLIYERMELPVKLNFFHLEGHIVSVCGEEDFSTAELIELPYILL